MGSVNPVWALWTVHINLYVFLLRYRWKQVCISKPENKLLLTSGIAASVVDSTKAQLDGFSDHQSDILEAGASDIDDSPWEASSDSEDGHVINKHDRYPSGIAYGPNASILTNPFTGKEPNSALDLVNFIISCLWRLPIRRPAPLDRMKERSTAETSYYQPFDIMHVKDKFPSINETVARRLGKMISTRRQLLRYRQSHTDSLQGKSLHIRRPVIEAVSDQDHGGSKIAPSFVTSTHHTLNTKATTFRLDAHNQISARPTELYAPSISQSTSSAGSEQNDGESAIIIPNRPQGENGEASKQFICPYCQTTQSIETDHRWK